MSTQADEAAELSPPRGRILRRIATYAPSSVVPAVLTMVTSVIFTRLFTPAAFGVYGLFLVVATTAKLVATTWVTQGTGKYLPAATTVARRDEVKRAIFLSLVLVLVVEGAVGLLAMVVSYPISSPVNQGFLLPVLLFAVLTSAFEIVGNVFPAEHRAREYTTYKLIDSVATFGLRLLLVSALVRMDVRLMFWSVALSNLVLLPFMWRGAGLPSLTRTWSVFRSASSRRATWTVAAFGFPMTLWFFSSILLDVGDRYVINYFLGAAPVGIYDANYRLIAGSVAVLVVPITITLHPYLMGISAKADTDHIGSVIATIVENLTLVGTVAVGLTYVFHQDIAKIMLGEKFREGSLVMPVVLAGVFLFNVGTFTHKPFEIVGRTRPMVAFGAAAAATNLIACFVLIPVSGYVGAAYATLVAYSLYTVGVGVLGQRLIAWRLAVGRLLLRLVGIGVGTAAIWALRAGLMAVLPYWWALFLSATVGGAVGGAVVLWLMRRSHPED
ncbi:MAG: polysaccharide biosynthesis C-terminal domain-containing protein [Kineosporiaceae bacterium]